MDAAAGSDKVSDEKFASSEMSGENEWKLQFIQNFPVFKNRKNQKIQIRKKVFNRKKIIPSTKVEKKFF